MFAYVKSSEPWLDEYIKSYIVNCTYETTFVENTTDIPAEATSVFQICNGVDLHRHFALLNGKPTGLINAYPNSDALARKDHLALVVEYWTAKRPESILKYHIPNTVRFTLDYSEYVEDSLMEADDLSLYYSLQDNEKRDPWERDWWILKPALCDCGAGIRIFSTVDELAGNLELAANLDEAAAEAADTIEIGDKPKADTRGFDPSLSSPFLNSLDVMVTATVKSTVDDISEGARSLSIRCGEDERIPSSQMREFVAQQYIASVPVVESRKWHVRVYVLAIGRLKVYVFRKMLALLALDAYKPPWQNPSLKSFLTNTALQEEDEYIGKESMRDFWTLPDALLPGNWKDKAFHQICDVSAELFRATAHTMPDKFVLVDNCFELYALDFLLDDAGVPWLLEANETPAFYQHGVAGMLAERLLESVVFTTLNHMGKLDNNGPQYSKARNRFVEVLDETEKLGKSNIREIVPEG